MNLKSPAELSDSELLGSVKRLVQSERQATAALVVHLAEIERRKLYLEEGCRSLFSYCTRVLHLSEHAAYKRIEAARVAVRFPAVLNSLEHGDVHLTAVQLLGPLLTPENHHGLLAAAKHKSKREVEALIARLRPQADVPVSVRKLPVPKPEENRTAEPAADPAADPAPDPDRRRGRASSYRWPRSATKFNSLRAVRLVRSCGVHKNSCGIGSQMAI